MYAQVITAHFDSSSGVVGRMDTQSWRTCHDDIMELLLLIKTHDNLHMSPTIIEDDETIENPENQFYINQDITALVERLGTCVGVSTWCGVVPAWGWSVPLVVRVCALLM